jgi:hypothetical protein
VSLEHVVHSFHTVTPLISQAEEGDIHVVQRLGPSANVAMSMLGALRHKTGGLEDRDVALHSGERHRIGVSEFRDRALASQCPGNDVTPGRIGECSQLSIEIF